MIKKLRAVLAFIGIVLACYAPGVFASTDQADWSLLEGELPQVVVINNRLTLKQVALADRGVSPASQVDQMPKVAYCIHGDCSWYPYPERVPYVQVKDEKSGEMRAIPALMELNCQMGACTAYVGERSYGRFPIRYSDEGQFKINYGYYLGHDACGDPVAYRTGLGPYYGGQRAPCLRQDLIITDPAMIRKRELLDRPEPTEPGEQKTYRDALAEARTAYREGFVPRMQRWITTRGAWPEQPTTN